MVWTSAKLTVLNNPPFRRSETFSVPGSWKMTARIADESRTAGLAKSFFPLAAGLFAAPGDQFVGGKGSFELPLTYFAVTIVLIALGPGAYSIDALIFRQRGASRYRR